MADSHWVSAVTRQSNARVTGDATFDGPTVSFSDNVRGINLPVSSGATSEDVTFGTAYPDTSYAVQCTPSYNTTCYITGKTTTGSNPTAGDFMFDALDTPTANTVYTFDYFIAQ